MPVVALIFILIQAFDIMLKIAQPLGDLIPIDKIGGVAVANILVILLIILICFIAGLFATKDFFKKVQHNLEQKILLKIPGYVFIKGITKGMKENEEASEHFLPVLVRFDDCQQMGFEIERISDTEAVVYLPGSPNPWSGTVVMTNIDRVRRLDISVPDTLAFMERLGLGTTDLIKNK